MYTLDPINAIRDVVVGEQYYARNMYRLDPINAKDKPRIVQTSCCLPFLSTLCVVAADYLEQD